MKFKVYHQAIIDLSVKFLVFPQVAGMKEHLFSMTHQMTTVGTNNVARDLIRMITEHYKVDAESIELESYDAPPNERFSMNLGEEETLCPHCGKPV